MEMRRRRGVWNDRWRRSSTGRKIAFAALALLAAFYAWIGVSLAILRFADPPTTALQMQRRVESWFRDGRYVKRQKQVAAARISAALRHAVVAAEDARFYTHHGVDLAELKDAVADDLLAGRFRGASTITQQMVKNLFFGTHGSIFRKLAEFAAVPAAELILGKDRILEIYLNIIEWGPGVYGAEAAAEYHYRTSAARVDREMAARLAAVLPAPRRRNPHRMDRYAAVILERMRQQGR